MKTFLFGIVMCLAMFSAQLPLHASDKTGNTMIKRQNYDFLGAPVGPYTHAVKHGNTLYLSGLTAFGSDAQSKSISEQTKAIYATIEKIAKAEKTDLSSLVKVTIFVTDLSEMQNVRDTLFEIYGDHIPASALIQVNGLFHPDLKIEVQAVLAVD